MSIPFPAMKRGETMNHTTKILRAINHYKGFKGHQTIQSIINEIPQSLIKDLSSKQLGLIMNTIHSSHQKGKQQESKEAHEFLGKHWWEVKE